VNVALGSRLSALGREPRAESRELFYQLAFRTPGIIPLKASSLKQIRHSPNRRRYARDRPQRLQRLFFRVENFGFSFPFSINDFGGMPYPRLSALGFPPSAEGRVPSAESFLLALLSSVVLNGIPSSFSSASA
jgi:hypothetical protein